MNFLVIGDVVGRTGRTALKENLKNYHFRKSCLETKRDHRIYGSKPRS